ncbi:hypothetical protein NM208_g10626 [Fusarium decemcellulare]|uniref:Uncharacterized protein n=1 Tax=Fusarium decemcellulare TaxID=57161 RepID=A0ACC1RXP0_9HYPO|nr:hypothetical protein NM208_g10626 [Fusarium decemcellulare]
MLDDKWVRRAMIVIGQDKQATWFHPSPSDPAAASFWLLRDAYPWRSETRWHYLLFVQADLEVEWQQG